MSHTQNDAPLVVLEIRSHKKESNDERGEEGTEDRNRDIEG
jgi:hypothetical protein